MRRQVLVFGGLGLVAAFGLVLAFVADDPDDDTAVATTSSTSTTLASGGIEVDAPDGYRAIPLPSFALGIALPESWEVTRTDARTLAALEGRNLVNEDFVPAARRAAQFGAVLYGAGRDADGKVDDAQVRIFDRGRATTAVELRAFADDLVRSVPLRDAQVEASATGGTPVVTIAFAAGTASMPARGTEVLRADGERIVSIVVTSEHVEAHDGLVDAIVGSLVLA